MMFRCLTDLCCPQYLIPVLLQHLHKQPHICSAIHFSQLPNQSATTWMAQARDSASLPLPEAETESKASAGACSGHHYREGMTSCTFWWPWSSWACGSSTPVPVSIICHVRCLLHLSSSLSSPFPFTIP